MRVRKVPGVWWLVWLVFGAILVVTLLLDKTFEVQSASVGVDPTVVRRYVGSGQPGSAAWHMCQQKLNDHRQIAGAILEGVAEEELVGRAANHPIMIADPDRLKIVLVLIPEAYAAGDAKAWFRKHFDSCMKRLRGEEIES